MYAVDPFVFVRFTSTSPPPPTTTRTTGTITSTGSHRSSTTSGRPRRCYTEEIEAAGLNTELCAKSWFPWTFSLSQDTTGEGPWTARDHASVSFVNIDSL
jgi:hypothetical protein